MLLNRSMLPSIFHSLCPERPNCDELSKNMKRYVTKEIKNCYDHDRPFGCLLTLWE